MSADENPIPDLSEAEKFDHLAGQCWVHRRNPDAAGYYRQALAVRECVLGPEHVEVAESLVRLAGVLTRDEGERAEAETLWLRAVGIYERLYRELSAERGEPFDDVVMSLLGTLGNLACAAAGRGEDAEAERQFRHVLAVIEEAYGPDSRWVHPALPAFARVLVRRGKYEEAEARLLRVVELTPEPGSIDEWIRTDCQVLLAELYALQGRDAEAEAHFRGAVGSMEGDPGHVPELLASALGGLAVLCRRTGRGPEADRLDEKARQVRRHARPDG